jgi:hypothetical protein
VVYTFGLDYRLIRHDGGTSTRNRLMCELEAVVKKTSSHTENGVPRHALKANGCRTLAYDVPVLRGSWGAEDTVLRIKQIAGIEQSILHPRITSENDTSTFTGDRGVRRYSIKAKL